MMPMGAAGAMPVKAVQQDIARVVVRRGQISRGVRRLAGEIAARYDGHELTVVAVLTGSLIFLADLIRQMPLMMCIELVSISSYRGRTIRSQGPRFLTPPAGELAGKHVLVVDDILDTGKTLGLLLDKMAALRPASLRTCVLLRKNCPEAPERVQADFVGFDVGDEFVVGYGLDYNGRYRNLPDICVLHSEATRPIVKARGGRG